MKYVCKHCAQRIYPVNWYDGPGWRHEYSGNSSCPPVTRAEPIEDDEEDA